MKKFTQEQIDKKLREIQNSIPRELLEFDTKLQYPTVNMVVEKALESPDIPEEKKEELRRLIRLGMFNKTYQVLDKSKQDKVNEYLEKTINAAIRNGELPPASQSPFMRRMRKNKWI